MKSRVLEWPSDLKERAMQRASNVAASEHVSDNDTDGDALEQFRNVLINMRNAQAAKDRE